MNIKKKLFYIGISIYDSNNKKGNKKLVGNLGRMIFNYINENYI